MWSTDDLWLSANCESVPSETKTNRSDSAWGRLRGVRLGLRAAAGAGTLHDHDWSDLRTLFRGGLPNSTSATVLAHLQPGVRHRCVAYVCAVEVKVVLALDYSSCLRRDLRRLRDALPPHVERVRGYQLLQVLLHACGAACTNATLCTTDRGLQYTADVRGLTWWLQGRLWKDLGTPRRPWCQEWGRTTLQTTSSTRLTPDAVADSTRMVNPRNPARRGAAGRAARLGLTGARAVPPGRPPEVPAGGVLGLATSPKRSYA